MLPSYYEFIKESLITESIIVYSKPFKTIVNSIDSPVAKELANLETKDIETANNYIDIGDTKELISFIPDRRAKQIEENKDKFVIPNGDGGYLRHSDSNAKIFLQLEYEPVGNECYHPNSNERGEVLKKVRSSVSGKVYLKIKFPGGITVINEDGVIYEDISKLFFNTNRQTIRVGRGIKALLNSAGVKFSDSEIEVFVNKFKSEWDRMHDIFANFSLVKGDEIAHWYDYNNYSSKSSGTLGSSCMKSVPDDFFKIYSLNEDKCKLLILKDPNDTDTILGRALVWNLDTPKITMMDRIYTRHDSDVELFRKYAIANKWYYKYYNGSSAEGKLIGPEGEVRHVELSLKLNQDSYDKYPYLDTLKYFYTKTSTLSNLEGIDNVYVLEATDGTFYTNECDTCDSTGRVECNNCDGGGEVACYNCDGGGEVNCETCNSSGEVECSSCDGVGDIDGKTCEDCDGTGEVKCEDCDGDGKNDCGSCDGTGTESCDDCSGSGSVSCGDCRN